MLKPLVFPLHHHPNPDDDVPSSVRGVPIPGDVPSADNPIQGSNRNLGPMNSNPKGRNTRDNTRSYSNKDPIPTSYPIRKNLSIPNDPNRMPRGCSTRNCRNGDRSMLLSKCISGNYRRSFRYIMKYSSCWGTTSNDRLT